MENKTLFQRRMNVILLKETMKDLGQAIPNTETLLQQRKKTENSIIKLKTRLIVDKGV